MPITGSKGAQSSQGFGQFTSSGPTAGFVSNNATTDSNFYPSDVCTDGGGNFYIVGATNAKSFIMKLSSTGAFVWAYYVTGVNLGSCDYYNGNVYWLAGNRMYVVPAAGATSVTSYTGFQTTTGLNLKMDSSGNIYTFGVNDTLANPSFCVYKYNSTGTALSFKEYYDSNYSTLNVNAMTAASFNRSTGRISCGLNNAGIAGSFQVMYFSWMNGSLDYTSILDLSYSVSSCTDNSGNSYIIGQALGFSRMYIVALNSSGTVLWRKWLNPLTATIPGGGIVTCDNLGYVYVAFNGRVVKLNASTGAIVWAKTYSTYVGAYTNGSVIFSNDLIISTGIFSGTSAPTIAVPISTGGTNGTYASCVVATGTTTATDVTPGVYTGTVTTVTPTLVNLTSSTSTLTNTTTVFTVSSSATVPV